MEKVLVISSQLTEINEVRNFIEKSFNEFSLNKAYFNHIFIGISEAVNNAILHGNKLNSKKNVFIRLNFMVNQLRIEIEDEGDGFYDTVLFDPTNPESIKLEHGRGIFILRQIADELTFKDGGKKVIILFTIPE